jgi:spore photoproduct lyase
MWGNSHGVLEALWRFAETHPNVILELKSKSDNIAWLVKHPPPANVICTWSLNPQPLIEQEELGAASLARRLGAARAVADLGNLVGFHFHPMVRYQGWQEGYQGIAGQLEETFAPAEVALVSIGTLTFIKPVLKKLRREGRASRILQMPLVESAGKWSYPPEVKVALFRTLYRAFGEEWRERVFFYLCMEDHGLWQKVFGHEYGDNEALERAMIGHYRDKIEGLQGRRA